MREEVRLEARHQPSGLNSRFITAGSTFAEYVAHTRDMLAHAHARLRTSGPGRPVDGNAPFELIPHASAPAGKGKPFRRGILLVHGLTDSPYFMRYLASFYREQGFRVMAVLLPGHGTRPGDLLGIQWKDWAAAVAWGTDRLAEQADDVYLAGYSAGGALSIYQSLSDQRVRGLFLFSPALKISCRAAFANFHKLYSWLAPSARWVDIKPDIDTYKYESFPKNAAAQMYALVKTVNERMPGFLDIPVFAAASVDDVTVDVTGTLRFFARARHPASRLVLYTRGTENLPGDIPEEKLELVDCVFPERKILGSAHTAIVIPPEDEHYGEQGEYGSCVHYYPHDMESYTACINQPERCVLGEVTEANLKAGILRRLMYNPEFKALKVSMQQFISGLR